MKKVLIAAGHSKVDSGATNPRLKLTEASLALHLRDLVASELASLGVVCVEDGADGENLPLPDSIKLARGADIAVELHFNASDNPAAGGVESISLPAKGEMARQLSRAVAKVLGVKLRGEGGWIDQAKSARGKLGFVNAGGIILEVCFISNDAEITLYRGKSSAVARAIAEVVRTYAKESKA